MSVVNEASLEDLARASLSLDSSGYSDDHPSAPNGNSAHDEVPLKPFSSSMLQTKSSPISLRSSPSTMKLTLTEKLGRSKNDEFDRLKRRLVQSGKLYEDPYFPANGKWL